MRTLRKIVRDEWNEHVSRKAPDKTIRDYFPIGRHSPGKLHERLSDIFWKQQPDLKKRRNFKL